MSVYKLRKFGDELLPVLDAQWQLAPAPARAAVQNGLAGPYDAAQGAKTPSAVRMIEFTGTYIGDPDAQLRDEAGEILQDENGNDLVVDQSLEPQVERLTSMMGQTALIERQRLSDRSLHYLAARLLSIDLATRPADGSRIATLLPRFETAQAAWHSGSRQSLTGTLDMSLADPAIAGANAGLLPATRAIVTLEVERRGTSLDLWGLGGDGQSWHWRLAFDETDAAAGIWHFDVDAGLAIQGPGGGNVYSRWTLGEGHTIDPLIWLAPGAFTIGASEEVDTTNTGGGDIDVTVQYYEEYP